MAKVKDREKKLVAAVEKARDKCMREFKGRKERRACVIGAQLAAVILSKNGNVTIE